jgi:leucyl-tRNA synthetase
MMEFVNEYGTADVRPKALMEPFVLLLSPFAPHLAEELWALLGHDQTLACEPWPKYDPVRLVEAEVEVPVQVNGKLRSKARVPKGCDEAKAKEVALADAKLAEQVAGKQIVKVVYVPDRLLNFVVK